MKCKVCGAVNEDYLEYCENCAALLTPDEPEAPAAPEEPAKSEGEYSSYVAATGETPPAWGFVRAPKWPRPEFDANTVTEEDIPEGYVRRFNPRPADAAPAQYPPAPEATAVPYVNDVRVRPAPEEAPAPRVVMPVGTAPATPAGEFRLQSDPRPAAPRAPRAQKPLKPAVLHDSSDEFDMDDAPIKAPRPKVKKTSGGFSSGRRNNNIIFIAAAGVFLALIVVFCLILVNRTYGGSFAKFISCTFKGDPVTKAPTVELDAEGSTDTVKKYLITVYGKNNYTLRFTGGEIVSEHTISNGYIPLRIPESIWIPDEPLDASEIRITPDIVLINPNNGEETKVEFAEEIVITVPAIELSMTNPVAADFTVDTATVAVSGVVSDNTAAVYIGDAQIAVDEAGNFATTYTLPGEGTYEIAVEARKNGCKTARAVYNATYGVSSGEGEGEGTGTVEGNVVFAVNEGVKRYGTDDTVAVTGTMEAGAVITVTGVDLTVPVAMDTAAGTFSFTVNTKDVGIYPVIITATKGNAAKTTTLYLEHQPDKDAYMKGVYALDYSRIRDYPNHDASYKVVGTVTEIIQSAPYVIARIKTSEGDLLFTYYSGVSAVEVGDGKTYELYADPDGKDDASGLTVMHAWFILKRS